MRIHVLADNRVYKRGLLAEHGLSLFIEHEGQCILFDTGQSDIFCGNAARMGVDLARTRFIVLSHGHYDHCGGLPHFPRIGPFPQVWVQPAAFAKRWAGSPGQGVLREAGIPWSAEERARLEPHIAYAGERTTLYEGVHLLSRVVPEDGYGAAGFYTGEAGNPVPDRFADEQMLVVDTPEGLVLFLGCSHPGVTACLRHARSAFAGKPIRALVAGMHMSHTPLCRLADTLASMMDMGIERIVPLHCTGTEAIGEIRRMWGDGCIPACVGDSFVL